MTAPPTRLPSNPLAAIRDLPARMGEWFPKGPQGLTVLSIDGQWLRLLYLAGHGAARTVSVLFAHQVDHMTDDEVLAWLKEACTSRGFEPGSVLVANPSHLTTTRLFTLPSTDPAEIRDIVELQAEKHTPYAKEEILTDFRLIELDRAGYSRVLLVVSHQDIVHRGLRLVSGMGWLLERVGFELEGLASWCHATHQEAVQGAMLVAEISAEVTTVMILHQGKPYFHRSLSLGTSQLAPESAENLAKLVAEFQRSLEAFESEGLNLQVSSVLLTGQVEQIAGLKEQVEKGLSLPVTVLAPFARCTVAPQAGSDDAAVGRVSFASLLGLAIAPGEIDLTPKALKLRRAFEARAKALLGLGCQIVGGLLLISCLVIGKAQKGERSYAALVKEYQVVDQEARALESRLDRVGFVKDWLGERGRLLDAMAELSRRTPPMIQWNAITYVRGQELTLKGVSDEMPKVYDFTAELKRYPVCTQVEARRVSKRKVGDRDMTEFEVVCSLGSVSPGGQTAGKKPPG